MNERVERGGMVNVKKTIERENEIYACATITQAEAMAMFRNNNGLMDILTLYTVPPTNHGSSWMKKADVLHTFGSPLS